MCEGGVDCYTPFAPLGLTPLPSAFVRVFRVLRDSDKIRVGGRFARSL